MRGQILEDPTLVKKQTIGQGTNSKGRCVNISVSLGMFPVIEDVDSGRTWLLDWPAIVDLAIEELDSSQQGVIDVAEST